jgi:hypothetical protein
MTVLFVVQTVVADTESYGGVIATMVRQNYPPNEMSLKLTLHTADPDLIAQLAPASLVALQIDPLNPGPNPVI